MIHAAPHPSSAAADRPVRSGLLRRSAGNRLAPAVCLAATALAASAQWYIEVGPAYRGAMEASVRGGTHVPSHPAGLARGGLSGTTPSPRPSLLDDDPAQPRLRIFDDGHVGPSDWQWAREAGLTQHFGYIRPDQHDPQTGRLLFRTTLSETTTGRHHLTEVDVAHAGWNDSKAVQGAGVFATVGYAFADTGPMRWDLHMRLGRLDGIQARFRRQQAFQMDVRRAVYETTQRQEQVFTYAYETLGNPLFPNAPYAMDDSAGVGPLIRDLPTAVSLSEQSVDASERVLQRSVTTRRSLVDLDLDAGVFVLQVGSRIDWRATPRLVAFLRPGVSVNSLDVSLRRSERLHVDAGAAAHVWKDSADEHAWRIGASLHGGVQWAVFENWDLGLAGGFDWVDACHVSVGPDRLRLDLSGLQAEFFVRRRF